MFLVSKPVNVYHMGFNFFWGISCNKRVRQGGVMSPPPPLFNVYINELSECLNKSSIGGSMNGTIINNMLCADYICIISLSSAGLQQLRIYVLCSGYSKLHDLTFNAKKINVYAFQHQYE